MRGISLMLLIIVLLVAGAVYLKNVTEAVYTERGAPTTEHVEQQVEGLLQEYQGRLDSQVENQ